ncbi:MAG: site-specific integrase [Mariprofundaceae bacterium]|nr:site-specific integrase [Mariprofundaceae bacterium]
MATYRKRGPYQWQAMIRKKGYPQQTKTFETKEEAMAWAAGIESKMYRGLWRDMGDADKTTLHECLERYRTEVTPKKKGAPQELSRLNVLQRSSLAECFMINVRSKDVADYRNHREAKGLAANTIRNELNLLSAIFETCRKEWGMEALLNPVKDVKRPTPPQGRDRRLAEGEEQKLLDAAGENRSPWIRPIIILALESAMRAGEIAGLNWKYVNIKKRQIFLPKTKNGEARKVPLSSKAISELQSLPRRIDGHVFGIGSKSISYTFQSVCKAADVDGLRFHDLRHEATSRMFEKGLDASRVKAITGHKTWAMLDRYTHHKIEDLADLLG